MDNFLESERWMKDAEDSLSRARRCFKENDWRGTIQSAQLAIELSVKAIIALFEEPDWTHNPGKQLKTIIQNMEEKLKKRFPDAFLEEVLGCAEDAEFSAPWHGWSVYGKEGGNGRWVPAVELCNRTVACDLLERAERTFMTARRFLEIFTSRK